jgi:hypothetical protein
MTTAIRTKRPQDDKMFFMIASDVPGKSRIITREQYYLLMGLYCKVHEISQSNYVGSFVVPDDYDKDWNE